MSSKKPSWKNPLLWIILFSHVVPVFVSAHYDKALHPLHKEAMKLTDPKYWLWFFTWWSAWASLLTIPWIIYKLFNLKKKTSQSKQLIDLIITATNLVSGVIFCFGGFLFTLPASDKHLTIIYPLLGEVKTIYIWLFYNFLWHILAPSLVFYYFCKYSQVDKLRKQKKTMLITSLLNPTIYFFYVFFRPLVAKLPKIKGRQEIYAYPRDYPYPFFFWCRGEVASSHEANHGGNFFWHFWPKRLQILFWTATIFFLGYLSFSLLFSLLIKIKTCQEEKNFYQENTKPKYLKS